MSHIQHEVASKFNKTFESEICYCATTNYCWQFGIRINHWIDFFLKIWSNNSFFILAKVNWDSQRNFPISFIPKVAIAKLIGKMQKSLATVLWKVGWTPYKVANKTQCLIWHYKLHRNLLGFLSKSQISEKIPSTFWRVFWCTHGCFC